MTLIHPLCAPKISPNDDRLLLVGLLVDDGGEVRKGQEVLELEGTKAVVAVESPISGVFHALLGVGETVAIGGIVAVISPPGMRREEALAQWASEKTSDQESLSALPAPPPGSATGVRFTKAAMQLVLKNGLSTGHFAGMGLVSARQVENIIAGLKDSDAGLRLKQTEIIPSFPGANGQVLLAGAGPGAYQVLEILGKDPESQITGFLDDNPEKWSLSIRGIPVLGSLGEMVRLCAEKKADSILCTTPSSIPFRQKVGTLARAAGLRLATAVHKSAIIAENTIVAPGSVIGPLCYIGPETILGESCFLSSRTTFEHHNRIGSWVTTGPNVATSGLVVVGSGVRFGTGIVVEPNVTIGDRSIIASGSVIDNDIPVDTIVKSGPRRRSVVQSRKKES